MTRGMLYGVSVGPGDPELLTLKAVRIIGQADVVAVPDGGQRQTARSICDGYLDGKELLECATPMTRDKSVARAAYEKIADDLCTLLDAGKQVAYLCLGDIGVYSTYAYVHEIVVGRGYEAQIIPGVTSFSASAAKLGTVLCTGSERLVVTPPTGPDIDDVLDMRANKVFMKSGKSLGELRRKLAEHGQLDNASMVANCGLPDERVYEHFADADENADYFSVVIVKNP